MTANAETSREGRGFPWRMIGWGAAALILLLPLVSNAPWNAFDFTVVGVLIGSVGLGIELIARKSASLAYRFGAVLAVAAAFLVILANLAVGMIGSEDNPFNLLFGGVLLVGLIGALMARFEPFGMALAMIVTAIAQAAVGGLGLSADMRWGILSMAFAGLWLLAAALFWKAAQEQTPAGSAQ